MARRNLLKGFKRPKGINFEHSEISKNYGKFIAYPFERGFGTTVGMAMRPWRFGVFSQMLRETLEKVD